MVHIAPTGGQTAEDIAQLATATDRGMDASRIGIEQVEGRDVVVAPRALVLPVGATLEPEHGSGPVELIEHKADGPDVVAIEDWASVVQYRR